MARLYGRRWRKLRRDPQLKVEPLCRLCDAAGRVTAGTVADHVEPHEGDPVKFWHGELQTLCETCHNAVKQAQERTGYLRGSDLSGMPLDPEHPWNT